MQSNVAQLCPICCRKTASRIAKKFKTQLMSPIHDCHSSYLKSENPSSKFLHNVSFSKSMSLGRLWSQQFHNKRWKIIFFNPFFFSCLTFLNRRNIFLMFLFPVADFPVNGKLESKNVPSWAYRALFERARVYCWIFHQKFT